VTAAAQPPAQPVVFLTVAEVSAQFRVSKMTVYRAIHDGDLTAARIGRSFRVPESALNDWVAPEPRSGS
jgi:excisionase family DNA binding protein